jgi:hypothetical protein
MRREEARCAQGDREVAARREARRRRHVRNEARLGAVCETNGKEQSVTWLGRKWTLYMCREYFLMIGSSLYRYR